MIRPKKGGVPALYLLPGRSVRGFRKPFRKACLPTDQTAPDALICHPGPSSAGICGMLPDFRQLFMITVLSLSVLIFAFGAAGLLRTAHEDFSAIQFWQAGREPGLARYADGLRGSEQQMTLSVLQVSNASEAPAVQAQPEIKTSVSAPPAPDAIARPENNAAVLAIAPAEEKAAGALPSTAERPAAAPTADQDQKQAAIASAQSAPEAKPVAETTASTHQPGAQQELPASAEPAGNAASPAPPAQERVAVQPAPAATTSPEPIIDTSTQAVAAVTPAAPVAATEQAAKPAAKTKTPLFRPKIAKPAAKSATRNARRIKAQKRIARARVAKPAPKQAAATFNNPFAELFGGGR